MAIAKKGGSTASGTSTTPGFTHGLSLASGDVLIVAIHCHYGTNNIQDNNGSTALTRDFYENSPDNSTYAFFSRVCGGSEPSSYAFTGDNNADWSVVWRVYTGVHSSIWDVAPATGTRVQGSTASTPITSADMTVTDGACGFIWCFTDSAGVTYSSPTNSYVDAIGLSNPTFVNQSWHRLGLSAGSVGTVNVTNDFGSTNDYTIHHIALKVASGSLPTVTTTAITNITANTASSGGTITSDGGSAITDYGVCWNTTGTPTIADSHTHDKP